MSYAFEAAPQSSTAEMVLLSLTATAIGILLLLVFILVRRALRRRHFQLRDRRVEYLRARWPMIRRGEIPLRDWFSSRMDRVIVEKILLEHIAAAEGRELESLREFARRSGLMDWRLRQVCNRRSLNKRLALIALGRMRLPESVPALWQALQDASVSLTPDVVKALGQVGIPEAAQPILRLISQKPRQCMQPVLQMALTQCYRSYPQSLLMETLEADDNSRPILARALAEIAVPGIAGDLRRLVLDPLAEVRACAARILAAVHPPYALSALSRLARDPEWFVRLRAAVAIGELGERQGIPLLIDALCDRNRLVRLRAAAALLSFRGEEGRVIQSVIATRDRYALQAFVSEMQRSGRLAELADGLALGGDAGRAAEITLAASLRSGCMHLLVDFLLRHPDRRVRARLAHMMAHSGDASLRDYLMQVGMMEMDLHRQRLLRWVLSRMGEAVRSGLVEEAVTA
jgi:hypothetical protein